VAITVINWTDRHEVGNFLREVSRPGGKRYLVYLHGKFSAPENIILTERDYVERYLLGDEASKKLFAIFMVRPVVLIGFSLTDPELTNLIRSTQGYAQSAAPTHFIILPLSTDQDEGAITGWLNGKYGIDPVFYRLTPKHEQLLDVLEELKVFKSEKASEDLALTTKASAIRRKQEVDPDDPHKGRWGGKAERNGRILRAEVKPTDEADWFLTKLTVEPTTASSRSLTGQVIFHLHPTFSPDRVVVEPENGKAEYEIYSYGAFTVGAEADHGKTKLELDLSTVSNAPARFKAQ
jgi:hypothetical protein